MTVMPSKVPDNLEEILDKYDKDALILYAWTMVGVTPKIDEGWYFKDFKIFEVDKRICISVYHRFKKEMPKEKDKELKSKFRYLKKRLKELKFIDEKE